MATERDCAGTWVTAMQRVEQKRAQKGIPDKILFVFFMFLVFLRILSSPSLVSHALSSGDQPRSPVPVPLSPSAGGQTRRFTLASWPGSWLSLVGSRASGTGCHPLAISPALQFIPVI